MNVTQARDAMMAVVRAAWLASQVTTAIPLGFDDVKFDRPADDANGNPLPWGFVSAVHTSGARDSLGGEDQGNVQHQGLLTIQCCAAKGFGRSTVDAIAQVAKRAVQERRFGTGGWFYNLRTLEVPDARYVRIDVVTGFRYQERLGE